MINVHQDRLLKTSIFVFEKTRLIPSKVALRFGLGWLVWQRHVLDNRRLLFSSMRREGEEGHLRSIELYMRPPKKN